MVPHSTPDCSSAVARTAQACAVRAWLHANIDSCCCLQLVAARCCCAPTIGTPALGPDTEEVFAKHGKK